MSHMASILVMTASALVMALGTGLWALIAGSLMLRRKWALGVWSILATAVCAGVMIAVIVTAYRAA